MNFTVITTQFWSLALQGLALGLIYSLVALGYTMVYGVLRLINFANSEVFMLGTFAVLWVEIELLGHPVAAKPLGGFELVYTLVIALVGSMIACAVASDCVIDWGVRITSAPLVCGSARIVRSELAYRSASASPRMSIGLP